MLPIQMGYGYGDPNEMRAQHIAEYRRHIERTQALAGVATAFLSQAFPHVQHGTLADLARTWADFQCGELKERITFLEAQPLVPSYKPSPEILIQLTDQRDRLVKQIDSLTTASEKMSEAVPGMSEMLDGAVMPVLQGQLEMVERQLSEVQAQLEAAEAPPVEEK